MNFSEALTALKLGSRVTRTAWHDDIDDKHLSMNRGVLDAVTLEVENSTKHVRGISFELFDRGMFGDTTLRLPELVAIHANISRSKSRFSAWYPSQIDILANDWMILPQDM
jgi:hypothetical protein